jgi:hypothetical protein
MDAYRVCASCAHFIKRHELECPFCGTSCPHVLRTPSPGGRRQRGMSRGQWLALGGALSLAGCSGAVAPSEPKGDGGAVSPSPSASAPVDPEDSGAQPGLPDGSTSCAVTAGSFACADGITCDRATEFCVLSPSGQGESCARAKSPTESNYPSQCAECPTCECVAQYISAPCRCVSLDDGGGIGIECAGCYGSPPTRRDGGASLRARRSRARRSW